MLFGLNFSKGCKISQKRLVAAIALDSDYLFCDKLNTLLVYVEIRVMQLAYCKFTFVYFLIANSFTFDPQKAKPNLLTTVSALHVVATVNLLEQSLFYANIRLKTNSQS